MERNITLSLFLLVATWLHAQCSGLPLPMNAQVVTTSGTVNALPGSVWVCGGLDVTIIASLTTIYMESGSTVQVIGQYNSGFMKGPGALTTQCDTCFWSFDNSVVFIPMSGDMNLGAACDPIGFDYAQAPTPGCAGIAAVGELAASTVHVELQPNPVMDRVLVQVAGGTLRGLDVVDLSGRTVLRLSADPSGAYDVRALRAGSYIGRVYTDQGVGTTRFVKK